LITLSPEEYASLEDELAPRPAPEPSRKERRRLIREQGAEQLGVSKRDAWTLYQLTKGR
jgi:hypothetical protein